MGVGAAILGVGATLLSKYLANLKNWILANVESGEIVVGQFPAEETVRNVGANYAEIQALNRSEPFIQFLNGKAQTLTVRSRFYRRDFTDDSPIEKINKLIEWTQPNINRRRPPLLQFFLGDGLGLDMKVILRDISDIRYSQPNNLGGVREVSFTMEFVRWSENSVTQEVLDTRYARTKTGDYYELLCQKEYGNPMIGVVIRQRHPDQILLGEGDIVKLPALEGVRGEVPQPQSIIFKTAFGRRDTPQKQLRLFWLAKRSKPVTIYGI